MTERSGLPRLARDTLRFLSGLLTISILVQFFIAGMSSVTNPDWWAYHLAWVNIFQWLVLPLPIVAWLGDKPRKLRVIVATLPIAQIALQYVLVHRALDGRLPIGVGLHALNAALMLLIASALTAGWPDSKRKSSDQYS